VVQVQLADGATVDIDQNTVLELRGSKLHERSLLFYGTEPAPWYFAARDLDDPNGYMVEGWATETIEELHMNFGLVLQKAPNFDRGSGNFTRPAGSQFCVNERGEVLRLRE